ncbi:uncharacterized protein METZ01_LOCUS166915 [marine metagenome]|uniref:Uncharacterized protein n=1 Tax=marine metagenome TaxID=408172 RepID=A0A382BKI7_9ZZZZ
MTKTTDRASQSLRNGFTDTLCRTHYNRYIF